MIRLDQGKHESVKDGYCVMEVVSYVAGEPWSDSPQCACPAISIFSRGLNDCMAANERQRLIPYILRIAGSRGSNDVYRQRGYMAADFAVRIALPILLENAGLPELAREARALPVINSNESALSAYDVTLSIRPRVPFCYWGVTNAAYATMYAAADFTYATGAYVAIYVAADADRRQQLTNESLALLDRMLALHTAPTPSTYAERLAELEK